MTKRQKVLLAIFLAMFLVPEVLWGAFFNALMSVIRLPFRSVYHNILFFNDHPMLAYAIIIFELLGTCGLYYLNSRTDEQNHFGKKIRAVLISALGIALLLLLFMNYVMNGISFP